MTIQNKYRITATLTGIGGAVLLINILQHYVPGFRLLDIGNGMFFVACVLVFVAGPTAYYYRSQLHLGRAKSNDQIAVETLARIASEEKQANQEDDHKNKPTSKPL